jgi:hypothetical protein
MNKEMIKDYQEVGDNLSQFKFAISKQYINVESNSYLVSYSDEFSKFDINEEIKDILKECNYDETTLEKETVVIFKKPIFINEFYCSISLFSDNKSKAIRLISNKTNQKKFITNFETIQNAMVFKVNDTVRGLILPYKAKFIKANAIDFYHFFSDEDKISKVTEAYRDLVISADIITEKSNELLHKSKEENNERLKAYEAIKNDINIASEEKNRLEKSSEENKDILNNIQSDITLESIKLEDIRKEHNELKNKFDELKINSDKSKDQIDRANEMLKSLTNQNIQKNDEARGLEEQIREMKKDINLTTLDMKGYSSESDKQLRYYFGFALCSIVFLAIVFFQMYYNAETFMKLIDTSNPKVDAWNILVSRLPLIAATTLVIGTLSALLFYLVNHIVSVNSDNMNMLKASILAEQITGTLPTKDMNDNEIRDYKRDTKIELVINVLSKKQEKLSNNPQLDNIMQVLKEIKPLIKK